MSSEPPQSVEKLHGSTKSRSNEAHGTSTRSRNDSFQGTRGYSGPELVSSENPTQYSGLGLSNSGEASQSPPEPPDVAEAEISDPQSETRITTSTLPTPLNTTPRLGPHQKFVPVDIGNVAVKVLRTSSPHDNERMRWRLAREASVRAGLNNPYIIPFVDFKMADIKGQDDQFEHDRSEPLGRLLDGLKMEDDTALRESTKPPWQSSVHKKGVDIAQPEDSISRASSAPATQVLPRDKRRPPVRGKPGKPTGHRSRPNPSNRDKDNSDDLVATSIILDTMWQEFEDIASSIVQVDERASVTTGRFCDLFIGTHESYGKVALKRPRIDQQSYSRRDIRRFLREVKTWQDLKHDFILPLIGVCRLKDDLFMVSPYMENGTLKGYLVQHPNGQDEVRLLYEIAEALAYLHGLDVIHGDIKCNNVLVSNDIHALLCDFGLTRLSSNATSTALKGAGTLRWQSPELLDDEAGTKTVKSDAWAFGMTVYEVLSGMIPYTQYQQDSKVLKAILLQDERPPMQPMFAPNGAPYYRAWRAAVRCWTRDPARRSAMEEVALMLKPPATISIPAQVFDHPASSC